MNNNSFFEFEEITNQDLKKAIIQNKQLHKYFLSDFEKIKATNYCGIIQIEGKDFYILPKISKDVESDYKIFTYMLMNVFDLKIENENLSGSKNQKHHIST